jgi:hypothetical protein
MKSFGVWQSGGPPRDLPAHYWPVPRLHSLRPLAVGRRMDLLTAALQSLTIHGMPHALLGTSIYRPITRRSDEQD